MATERYACPLCGWWRTAKYGVDEHTGKPREVRFDKMDVESAVLWRLEELKGAGRGSHDASIKLLATKKLAGLPEEIKDQIRVQCHKILEVLENEDRHI